MGTRRQTDRLTGWLAGWLAVCVRVHVCEPPWKRQYAHTGKAGRQAVDYGHWGAQLSLMIIDTGTHRTGQVQRQAADRLTGERRGDGQGGKAQMRLYIGQGRSVGAWAGVGEWGRQAGRQAGRQRYRGREEGREEGREGDKRSISRPHLRSIHPSTVNCCGQTVGRSVGQCSAVIVISLYSTRRALHSLHT